ncbi:MAG: hypothetical protein ABI444_07240 [Candidatus Kapaibacterium sp.]|jgi:hypothetical protein
MSELEPRRSAGKQRSAGTRSRVLILISIFAISVLGIASALAHGGVDDEPAPVAASAIADQLSIASYPGSYEIFVRYAVPVLQHPAIFKVFISQWSSNVPVNAMSPIIEFPNNSNVRVSSPLTRIADGSYQCQLTFTKDDSYSALLKFTVNGEEQIAAITPIYAGTVARQHLGSGAPAPIATSGISWWVILIGAVVLLLVVFIGGRYVRRRSTRMRSEHHVTIKTTVNKESRS